MEVNDLHVGRKLQVSSGIGAAVAGGAAAPSPPAICFTAVSGSAWVENGMLVGNPLAYPAPALEAQMMIARAPIQNIAAKAVSVLKVSNRLSEFMATGTPIDIMLGDVLGPCGIIAYTGPAQPFVVAGKDLIFTHISAQLHASLVKQQTTAAKNETDAAAVETNAKSENGAKVKSGSDTKMAVSTSAGPKIQVATPVAGAAEVATTSATLNTADAIAKQGLSVAFTKKPFDIVHPTKEGYRLRHVCLEGPAAEVYFRGILKETDHVSLPDYWKGLVHSETITVNLTPIGKYQQLYYEFDESEYKIKVTNCMNEPIHCSYVVYGERKDTSKNIPEYKGLSPDDYPGDNSEYRF